MGRHGREKAGRPPYQPTPEIARQVETMTGFGIRQEDIAIALDIHSKTMRKYYKRELDTGAIRANTRVAQALYKNAVVNENVQAQIWWTKCRMGWKGDYSTIEHTGKQSDISMHLLAATIISAQLLEQASTQTHAPDTINASVDTPPQNLLDAPPPTE